MINGSYKPDKNSNDTLLYINKNATYPQQIIKKLPKAVNDRLCRNSSSAEIFYASKVECQTALKNSGYKNVDFKYNQVNKNNDRQSGQSNIIWFNPPFRPTVSTNVAKRFLDFLGKHFPPNNQFHKIFNKNTVKVSYSCTLNVGSIIMSHNKKLTNAEKQANEKLYL